MAGAKHSQFSHACHASHASFTMKIKHYAGLALVAGAGMATGKKAKAPWNKDGFYDDGGPVIYKFPFAYVNYGVTMFYGPNCTGRIALGPYTNFGCPLNCFPAPGVLSVLLEGDWYDQDPVYGDQKHRHEYEHDGGQKRIEVDGPMAMAYSTGECGREKFISRTVIPARTNVTCATLEEPAYSFHLLFQRMCRPRNWLDKVGAPPYKSRIRNLHDWTLETKSEEFKAWRGEPEVEDSAEADLEEPGLEEPDDKEDKKIDRNEDAQNDVCKGNVREVAKNAWGKKARDKYKKEEAKRRATTKARLEQVHQWYLAAYDAFDSWREGDRSNEPPGGTNLGVIWGTTAQEQVRGRDPKYKTDGKTDEEIKGGKKDKKVRKGKGTKEAPKKDQSECGKRE